MTVLDTPAAMRLAERMLLMRRFEEKVLDLWENKYFSALYHLYIGQESAGGGVIEALRPHDHILTNHRNHGHLIARGADPGRAFAEILGRATGLCGGRSGSFHLCDASLGFLQTTAILGGNVTLAIGAAYALKCARRKGIVVVFFGDASLEEGVAAEALNIAAQQRLPVLFVLENNNLGSLSLSEGGFSAANTAVRQFVDLPQLYGIRTQQFKDGTDTLAIVDATREAIAACEAGDGPLFFEVMTVRWPGGNRVWPKAVTGATDLRMAWDPTLIGGEYADWIAGNDPVLRLARDLVATGACDRDALLALDAGVCRRLESAARFAIDSPFPEKESAYDHVFA
jgi:TPP-dependent pyruvate/acetoin dehydrogenase alpha subunit